MLIRTPFCSAMFLAGIFCIQTAYASEVILDGPIDPESVAYVESSKLSPAYPFTAHGAVGVISVFDSMNQALRYNPTLDSIQENREALLQEVKKAKAGYYPTVDLSASFSYSQGSTKTSRADNTEGHFTPGGSAGLQISQIIWNGNAVKNSVDFNIFRVESIDNRIMDNATYLALEALIAHLDVIRTREVVQLTSSYVDTHKSILEKQQSLNASGLSTGADVTQAQGRVVRAMATYAESLNAARLAEINYQKMTGYFPPADLSPVPMPTQIFVDTEVAIETAYARNAKILAYNADIKAAFEQIELAKAGYQPQLTLSAGPNYSNPSIKSGSDEYQWSLGATLGLQWNLFDGGATTASKNAAIASSRQVRKEMFEVTDTVVSDIYSTWANLNTAQELVLNYEEAKNYNTITRDNYLAQFGFGTRSLLDVLDAESELFSTLTQLTTVKANTIVNSWKLLALQGTLLDELNVDIQKLQVPSDRLTYEDRLK